MTPHNARLGVRLTNEQRELIEQAAGLLGQSVRDFAVSTMVREAQEVMARSVAIHLSKRDWDAFQAALDNPPEPNAKLRKAMRDHDRQVR